MTDEIESDNLMQLHVIALQRFGKMFKENFG